MPTHASKHWHTHMCVWNARLTHTHTGEKTHTTKAPRKGADSKAQNGWWKAGSKPDAKSNVRVVDIHQNSVDD